MTRAEELLAGRLLDLAAQRFSNLSCNDTEPSMFEGMDAPSKKDLAYGFNDWNGTTGEDAIPFANIGDDSWMAYLSCKLTGDI